MTISETGNAAQGLAGAAPGIDYPTSVATSPPADGSRVSRKRAGLWSGPWPWLVLVLVLFGLPMYIGLGRTDLENDEAIHSLVLEHLVATGNWLTPRSPDGSPFIEKPPLKFWIAATPIRLGLVPLDEFGLRFSDVAMGALAFLYVFAIGRRLGGPICGLATLVILFAHQPLVFDHSFRTNNMEAAVFLSYCAGVYHFLRWKSDADVRRRRWHLYALACAFVLGFMVKFVAVAFLPIALAPVVLLSADARARMRHDWRAWLGAAALAVALAAPWFLYQYHHYGSYAWKVIVGDHVITRFTAYLDKDHLRPWYFYWANLWREIRLEGAVTVLLAGLALVIIQTVRNRMPHGLLLLSWFVLPIALISTLTSKLYHYSYPFLPPLALAGGLVAALLATRIWSACQGWSTRVDRFFERRIPAVLRRPALGTLFFALALVAVVVAVATVMTDGHLRLAVGHVVLFRNANPLRPVLVAVLMFVLACRVGLALRSALVAVVLALLLPVGGYTRSLARLPVESHPLRSLGECMQTVVTNSHGEARPGIWIEADTLAHFYFYYFRALHESWQQRDVASDPTVYMHLVLPSQRTPVLLSPVRYKGFARAMQNEAELQERVAKKAGMAVAAVKAEADRTYTSMVRFPTQEVLFLPGPFSGCAIQYTRGGGR